MKDIPGFEKLYAIEEDGKIWSYRRNKYLKLGIGTNGYYIVKLQVDTEKKTIDLHRLLALTYIPNPENKLCIDHINRNRLDNRIENLRWVTKQENSENRSLQKNNILQEQYISIKLCKTKSGDYTYFIFKIKRNGETHTKHFKTLKEAVVYRDDYLSKV
jgi:hypothetical protein